MRRWQLREQCDAPSVAFCPWTSCLHKPINQHSDEIETTLLSLDHENLNFRAHAHPAAPCIHSSSCKCVVGVHDQHPCAHPEDYDLHTPVLVSWGLPVAL